MAEDDGFVDLVTAVKRQSIMKSHQLLGEDAHHIRSGLMKEGGIKPELGVVLNQLRYPLKLLKLLGIAIEEVGKLHLAE